MSESNNPYVSRGGLKLAAALDAFAIEPAGFMCADLGCSTGGFTDCLLQRGAAHVYAVDTAYGELAWKLRQDARVTVLERTNALHFDPWAQLEGFAGCDLVTVDLGWTRQQRAVPAALRWLKRDDPAAHLITLIKPHYESQGKALRGGRRGVLDAQEADEVWHRVIATLPDCGAEAVDWIASPVRGGRRGGNIEYLALLRARG
ncbi:MAG: SAM-dependent methyltransferase [Phycisphaeraceae bacterium]